MSPLAGRLALVTGASRGIGLATAEALAAKGAQVVRLARSLKPNYTEQYTDITCDVTSEPDLARAASQLAGEGRTPDILVNNAGIFLPAPLLETTPEAFRQQITVNLIGPFLVLRAFLPGMLRRGTGHIVTIGSRADHMAFANNAAYSASKYGLRGLHEVMAVELEGTGIRATLVSPGPTDTNIWDAVDLKANPRFPPRSAMRNASDVAAEVVMQILGNRSPLPAGERGQG